MSVRESTDKLAAQHADNAAVIKGKHHAARTRRTVLALIMLAVLIYCGFIVMMIWR